MSNMFLELALAIVPTVLAITLHEAAHGYAALALGDTTAKDAGRLSLNPLRHVDRMGTLIIPGVLLVTQLLLPPHRVSFMFGWAKPVPIGAWRFKDPRRGMAIVAMAGPAMNFFLAWLAALLLPEVTNEIAGQFLFYFILTNLVLGLFNLLPIPPLDGGRVVVGLLPLALARAWAELERFGIFIVLGLVFVLPQITGWNPVGQALEAVLPWAFQTIFMLAGHDLHGARVF
jgi:Zn-dependent protease